MLVKLRLSYGMTTEQAGGLIEIQKQYLTHVCLSFTPVICIIPNNFFLRVRFLAYAINYLSLPLTLLFFFALLCKLSFTKRN